MAKFSPGGFMLWVFATGHCTSLAMAEWPYGTADQLDPAGMS